MEWMALILISVVLTSFQQIMQRVLLREDNSDPVAYSVVFQILTGLFIAVFALLTGNLTAPQSFDNLTWNFILLVLLYGVGNIFLFMGLKGIEASLFTILFSTRGIFSVLASSILLSEMLSAKQWIGTAIIIFAIVVVNIKSLSKREVNKGVGYSLLAGLFFGLANTNDRYILSSFEIYPYLVIAFILPALVVLLFQWRKLDEIKKLISNSVLLKKMLLMVLVTTFSAITFFTSLQIAPNSSQVVIINLTSVVITVLLSAFILKEKGNLLMKVIGALLTFVGLLLVA